MLITAPKFFLGMFQLLGSDRFHCDPKFDADRFFPLNLFSRYIFYFYNFTSYKGYASLLNREKLIFFIFYGKYFLR